MGKRIYELILVLGSYSKPLKRKNSKEHTHKWNVYVRGTDPDSKINECIERVTFELHETFDNHMRETSYPFQVKETGYAGFEIPIHIYFKNREKPNHLTFVHDLCLLTNKPNESKTTEKLKFINPTREFEKCLVKAGAQLIPAPVEKKRSDSPPAKKQKSSALIPSKDMAKHSQQQQQQQQQQQPHQQQQPQQQQQLSKSSSKEFIDVFGAPLMVTSNGKEIKSREQTHQKHHQNHPNNHNNSFQTNHNFKQEAKQHHHNNNVKVEHNNSIKMDVDIEPQKNNNQSYIDDLQLIQAKISCLTDCDRLQRIVDIVAEAGDYNLTPKKFEFDLRRLDKRTLDQIDRCLH